jgi:hypothetical protein
MYRYTKGDVDWSVHTKRMLADIKPRLMKKNAAPLKISEMTGLTAPEKKKKGSTRGSTKSADEDDDERKAAPCKRWGSARWNQVDP